MDIFLIFFVISLLITIFYLYKLLHDVKFNYITVCNENTYLKSKVEDLKTYKTDVSKTFEILNNDLKAINEELKKNDTQTVGNTNTYTNTINPIDFISQNFIRQQNNQENNENIDQFTDQILNSVSRYLVQLSN